MTSIYCIHTPINTPILNLYYLSLNHAWSDGSYCQVVINHHIKLPGCYKSPYQNAFDNSGNILSGHLTTLNHHQSILQQFLALKWHSDCNKLGVYFSPASETYNGTLVINIYDFSLLFLNQLLRVISSTTSCLQHHFFLQCHSIFNSVRDRVLWHKCPCNVYINMILSSAMTCNG